MIELRLLVTAAQMGDKEAFGQIVTRFQDMAYASAYALLGDPYLAQDVAQDAFLEAWRNLAKLRDPAAFPGWFRRIVIGNSHRQIRSQPTRTIALEDAGSLYANLLDTVDLAETLHLRQSFQEAIKVLTAAQRLVMALFYVEGYSYKEIADYLETPVSTVKKRLFDARKQLQERMIPMLQQTLQATRPSQDDEFASKVQFFIALRDNDLNQMKTLLRQQPTLLQAKTEWKMALGQYYWPLGCSALHLAAANGNNEILSYLLSQNVDSNEKNPSGMTPLHMAVLMNQLPAVTLLLQHGAQINACSEMGQSALLVAVLRNNLTLAQHLLAHKADPTIADNEGRTAVDWALIRQNRTMIDLLVRHGAAEPTQKALQLLDSKSVQAAGAGSPLLGRMIDGSGKPLDGGAAPILTVTPPRPGATPANRPTTMLATGLKIIDLLCPLARGGQIGLFTPLSGVGFAVVLGQLIYSMHELHGGSTVWLLMESETLRAVDQKLSWRESGVDDKMVYVAGNRQQSAAQQRQSVEMALTVAEQLRQVGKDVLLLVDSQFAAIDGVVADLRRRTSGLAGAAITTIFHGHHTVGVEPDVFRSLDAVLTFDYGRAKGRFYPAIDPIRSTSQLLQTEGVSAVHRQVAAQAKRLLQRYSDLRAPMEEHKLAIDALWYIEDDPNLTQEIGRARRLDRFFTQQFHGAEPWTGMVGQLVDLADTLTSCRAIVEGKVDDLPEDAFAYVATLTQAMEKAKRRS